MSYIRDYFRSKELDKRKLAKERRKYMMITEKILDGCVDESLPNFNFSIDAKEKKEYVILTVSGWERTSTGFEFRNNFRFDESGKDILFDRYSVIRSNDKFESDGSTISDNFIKNNSKSLKSLMKIYQVYDNLYQRFEIDIQEELARRDKQLQFHTSTYDVNEKAYLYVGHTNAYLYVYGELGKSMLIKWLNELSDIEKSMDELLEQFISDVNDANIYFDEHLNKKYLRAYGPKFEYVLLWELMQYSPRGKALKRMYSNSLERKNTNTQRRRKKF